VAFTDHAELSLGSQSEEERATGSGDQREQRLVDTGIGTHFIQPGFGPADSSETGGPSCAPAVDVHPETSGRIHLRRNRRAVPDDRRNSQENAVPHSPSTS